MPSYYACIRLLNAYTKPLTYAINANAHNDIIPGSIVRVPVQKRYEYGIVVACHATTQLKTHQIRTICSSTSPLSDPYYMPFLHALCNYYSIKPGIILRRVRQSLQRRKRQKVHDTPVQPFACHSMYDTLDTDQKAAVDRVYPDIQTSHFAPTLLYGVTGSGKTHVYIELIRICIRRGHACLLLAPEIPIALELAQRIIQHHPDIPCYSFHAASSADQKRLFWQAIYHQQPCLLIGVHMPIIFPIPHLGCIIVDEEHDPGFQEKKHPKIHSKEAALMRAHTYHIPIVLGSATPSMQSLYNAFSGTWKIQRLPHRYHGAIAPIHIAHLTNRDRRESFWITKPLQHAIQQRLQRGEQSMIFLNRRGYHFFMRCSLCGHVFCCTDCSVSLTPHHKTHLLCHYCHKTWPEPSSCPTCQASHQHFIRKGIGTQQAVDLLTRLFPGARVARADLDTSVHRKKWQATLNAFGNGEIDILVGTQTITKGYDFPNVTLVGLLWADMHLGMPIYDTAERTLQQILQVAGRSGRGHKESVVIAQVMLEHNLFSYAHEDYYEAYYTYEMEFRHALGYPPCKRFAAIELRHEDKDILEQDTQGVYHAMRHHPISRHARILGPTHPVVAQVAGIHIRIIYIKSSSFNVIRRMYEHGRTYAKAAFIYFTPHPHE